MLSGERGTPRYRTSTTTAHFSGRRNGASRHARLRFLGEGLHRPAHGRPVHDAQRLLQAIRGGQDAPLEAQHVAHEETHHRDEDPARARRDKAERDNGRRHTQMGKRAAVLQGPLRRRLLADLPAHNMHGALEHAQPCVQVLWAKV